MPSRAIVGLAIVSSLLCSCTGTGTEAGAGSPTAVTPNGSPSPEETSRGPGSPTGECVNGYRTPGAGSALYDKPLRVIARTTGVVEGDLEVVEMRYFEGPEAPPSEMGYLAVVKRWYVKARLSDRPGWKGRFLVEQRQFGTGLSAVAPFDTRGFRSPDWRGFQWEGLDSKPARYPGLPGRWPGTIYDFVKGGAGIDIAGLPREVIGCLDGT